MSTSDRYTALQEHNDVVWLDDRLRPETLSEKGNIVLVEGFMRGGADLAIDFNKHPVYGQTIANIPFKRLSDKEYHSFLDKELQLYEVLDKVPSTRFLFMAPDRHEVIYAVAEQGNKGALTQHQGLLRTKTDAIEPYLEVPAQDLFEAYAHVMANHYRE